MGEFVLPYYLIQFKEMSFILRFFQQILSAELCTRYTGTVYCIEQDRHGAYVLMKEEK